jgi:O-antigen/teichoic acid export membrane protein
MQKRFFSSLALSLFLNLLIKPFSVLVIDVGVQRVLGNEIYGQYFVLLSLTLVFNIFLDLGINNFTTRFIAQDESHLNQHVSRVLYLRGLLFLVYAVLVFVSAWLIRLATEQYILLILLVLNQFLIQSVAFIRSLFSGLHLFKTDTLISVLDRALLILIMGSALLFSVSSITIYNFVLAQSICYLITFSLALWLIRKQLKSILPVFDLSYILDILKRSAPYALLVLLMMLYNRSDVVILKQISSDGNYQAGIYAQGYRLLDAFYMLGMIFAGLLFPVFSRMIHQHSKDLMALVQVTGKLLIGGAIGILFIVNYNGSYILHLIYGDKVDNESITVFFYLMLAFAAMSFNFIFGTLLTAGGFLKSLNFSALLGVIISVFSNIYLIPTMGALGCAISAFITQAFVSLVLVIISARSLQVYFNIRSIISFVLYAGSIFTIKQFVPLSISAGSSLWLDITLVLVFSFVFSIIDFNSLRKIWKLKEDTQ